jgi:pimeloyl-ACP methyl ester carboxylesterase
VTLLRVLALVWVAWALVLYFSQRRMLFPGRTAAALGAGESLPGAQLRLLELPGDVTVEAWWLPPPEGVPKPAPAILFTHGNMELVDEWVGSFEPLRRAGAGVLLVEFPGYGRSTGVATERSVTAAMISAYDQLAGMRDEVDPTRIVAFGRSVGGGPAAALSRERPLAALVLSSTFTSVGAFARRYFMPSFLVRNRFDSESAVRAFRGPVLVQHGQRDRTVPFVHGEQLAAAAADGRFIPYPCGHNDCPWGRMLDDAVAFLRERGILTGG